MIRKPVLPRMPNRAVGRSDIGMSRHLHTPVGIGRTNGIHIHAAGATMKLLASSVLRNHL